MKKRTYIALGAAVGALAVNGAYPRSGHSGRPLVVATTADIVHRGATLPPPGQSKPVPLVIALHESGGTPQGFEQSTGLDAVADQHGFVVAYLAYPPPTSPEGALKDMPTFLAYISSAIRQLIPQQNIDPRRVYVTGFSAGATIAFFAGCQLSGQIAGIAAVSGAMSALDPCKLTHPVSEMLVMGTSDFIPITGLGRWSSADAVAARWRTLDACTAKANSSVIGPITMTAWNDCNESSGVGLVIIAGGVHTWPSPSATGPDAQFDAAQAIWSFFAAHPGGPTSAVAATVSSVVVLPSRRKPSLRVVCDVREVSVTLRVTLSRASHVVVERTLALARLPQATVFVSLPPGIRGGRYSLTLSLADAYGRRTSVVRPIVVPSSGKS